MLIIHRGPSPLPTFFPLSTGTPIKNLLVHALTALDSHSHQATPDVSSQPSAERLPRQAKPIIAAHLSTSNGLCERVTGQQSVSRRSVRVQRRNAQNVQLRPFLLFCLVLFCSCFTLPFNPVYSLHVCLYALCSFQVGKMFGLCV